MTRKEAEIDAKKLNEREPQWFCPLINGQCKKDCINFMPAFVESTTRKAMVCCMMQKMTVLLWKDLFVPTRCSLEIKLSLGLPGLISLSIMNGWTYESLLILEMG